MLGSYLRNIFVCNLDFKVLGRTTAIRIRAVSSGGTRYHHARQFAGQQRGFWFVEIASGEQDGFSVISTI